MFSSAIASMKSIRKTGAASALAILFVLACAPAALLADEVVARVDGETVTRAEIDELLTGEMLKLERQRHEMFTSAVNDRVQEILIEREAAERGITTEELVKAEVEAKAEGIPDSEVQAFYRARRIRQPLQAIAQQIREYLARERFIRALEEKAEVEILIEPFRVDVAAVGPTKGEEGAPVTIVEFGDFECPPCGQAYPVMKKIRESFGDKVRFVFRQYPLLQIHPNAWKAGEASLCAHDQGKFWELHDRMFENQKSLNVGGLKELASGIDGLDTAAFNQCLDDGSHAGTMEEEMEYAATVGVSVTPSFFINGRPITGAPSYEAVAEVVEEELALRSGSEPTGGR